MTCPRCYAEFSAPDGVCPECGVRLLKSVSGMMKRSVVMIAAGQGTGFYRSVREVPEGLRQQLLRVTSSENSGTIVIADRAGKQQLTQIVARREAARGETMKVPVARAPAARARTFQNRIAMPLKAMPLRAIPWIVWAGVFLALASLGVVAAVFTVHW